MDNLKNEPTQSSSSTRESKSMIITRRRLVMLLSSSLTTVILIAIFYIFTSSDYHEKSKDVLLLITLSLLVACYTLKTARDDWPRRRSDVNFKDIKLKDYIEDRLNPKLEWYDSKANISK